MTVLTGDVMDALPTLPADSFDAMLTDPPYGLEFMGRDWDRVVPSVEVWRECLRVLKPGAFALVFGGTRTFHRLAVALEDAGFEMRDTLMWLYGSGFPKSHDVSKAIDKAAGAEREAARWQGYGTALKPAWESIILARKPTRLTYAENALEHECGALNIAGARVPFHGDGDEAEAKTKNRHADFGSGARENRVYGGDARDRASQGNYDPPGRWPANVLHDGSPEVVDLFPTTTARGHTPARRGAGGISTDGHRGHAATEAHFDTGSAARFFYTAKASTTERNAGLDGRNPHPTVKPLALTEYLAKLLLPPARDGDPRRILIPFAGSGSEAIGALRAGWDEAIGIEREAEYAQIAHARIAHHTAQPTIGGL